MDGLKHCRGQWGLPGGSAVKTLLAVKEMQEIWVQSLGREDSLEEEVPTHSSILGLESPMHRAAWQPAVHRATESQTQWQGLSSRAHWDQGPLLTYIHPFYGLKLLVAEICLS